MRRLRDISLQHKLTLIMLTTSAVALLVALVAFLASDTLDHEQVATDDLRTQAQILANATAAPLAFKLPEDAANTLQALRGDPAVVGAALYDHRGRLFATYARVDQGRTYQPPPRAGLGAQVRAGHLHLFHPVEVEGNHLGTIYLQADISHLQARFRRYLQIAVLVFLGALASAYLISVALRRIVSRPILQLAVVARAVAEHKDYSARARTTSADELGQLYDDFNEMLEQIQTRDTALRQAHDQLETRVRERTAELEGANRQLLEEISHRQRAEHEIRLLAAALRACSDCVSITDLNGVTLFVNEAFCRVYGFTADELIGQPITVARPGKNPAGKTVEIRDAALQGSWHGELLDHRKDGVEFPVWLSVSCIRDAGNQPTALVGVAQDLTERKKMEDQLRQAQKMEAVGQLAAGVAHDFNNILTVIQGRASLLREPVEPEELAESSREISAAAERAANVTRQLLAFSRKQVLQRRPLDLNDTVSTVCRLLGRLLGEHIAIRCHLGKALPLVQADRSMMEQVLINVAVNARDAMPRGGTLTLTTAAVELSTAADHPDGRPGQFVRLEVADSGCGMTADTLNHIFEPFFTTKEVGKGTGLGLATVYGILKQHEGWIEARSQVGKGSTFTAYLPVSQQAPGAAEKPADASVAKRGEESILVVEDEASVRELVCLVLRRQGYRVWPASSGKEALELWDRIGAEVDLVLTDMVMPDGISGGELAERLREQRPHLKVIFSSGYSLELVQRGIPPTEESNFLAKPYEVPILLAAVRKALEGQG